MTYEPTPYGPCLRCDRPDCTASFAQAPGHEPDADQLRALAMGHRWTALPLLDLCPVHSIAGVARRLRRAG